MRSFHILNGDALADQLHLTTINQDFIVCRECLVEGDVTAETLDDLYASRAKFIHDTYQVSQEDYFRKSVAEFERISSLPPQSEICLWFEDDLFCQVNMWFILSLLKKTPFQRVYRVFPVIPDHEDTWKGFGLSTTESLNEAYQSRKLLTLEDIELGASLWTAYKNNDFAKLKELSTHQSDSYHYLEEVCQAHIDRFPSDQQFGRPERTTQDILENISTDFNLAFAEFSKREGIYGFGDLQFRNIYDQVLMRLG